MDRDAAASGRDRARAERNAMAAVPGGAGLSGRGTGAALVSAMRALLVLCPREKAGPRRAGPGPCLSPRACRSNPAFAAGLSRGNGTRAACGHRWQRAGFRV